jgi:gamma-glutamylcyclotransferase (GGCT)/AIG2-like uncharacterized protein YtfP
MYPEVIFSIVKGKYPSCKATLQDYARKQVKQQFYPGLKHEPGAKVEGVMYSSVNAEDVKRLLEFENDDGEGREGAYIPKHLTVQTENGSTTALVYTYANAGNLEDFEWNITHFLETEFKKYAPQPAK